MKKLLCILLMSFMFVLIGCNDKTILDNYGSVNSNNINKTDINKNSDKEDIEDIYNKNEITEDLFSIEDCKIQHYTFDQDNYYIMFKIRNLTKEKVEEVQLTYQLLDDNGDILSSRFVCLDNVESNQAGWSDKIILDNELSEIGSVKVVSYSIVEQNYVVYQNDFINPMIIKKENITIETKD